MKALAQLFAALDRARRTSEQVALLEDYFRRTPPADAVWALWFLSGQRRKRAVKTSHLRQWAAEVAGLPLWLVEECYQHVGDLAETLALLVPACPRPVPPPLAQFVEQRLQPLLGADEATQRSLLRAAWAELDTSQRVLWHQLITGNSRGGVSRALLVRALAHLAGVEPPVMAHRLLGEWPPNPKEFARLISSEIAATDPPRPYPFCLALPLEGDIRDLGPVAHWQVEWQGDGLRAQLLRRAGKIALWSSGEEFVTAVFPEIVEAARVLPAGTVLDGELLAWEGEGPLPFTQLKRRLNRPNPGASLRRAVPVIFMAHDALESRVQDLRQHPLSERRAELERILRAAQQASTSRDRDTMRLAPVQGELFAANAAGRGPSTVVAGSGNGVRAGREGLPARARRQTPAAGLGANAVAPLRLSVSLPAETWEDVAALRNRARAAHAEGVMLKRRDSAYGVGCQRGAWWEWKVAPFTCNAVLVAAQPGHGPRAALLTDYTFAAWQGGELVPVARAPADLTDDEIDAVDAFVRENTTARFGPVRSVKPELVFELAFEGITHSSRHKSGLTLRLPRIARWRHDKPPAAADAIETLRKLAEAASPT